MVDPKLLNYIREQTAAGFSQVDVVVAARAAGWSEQDVSAALSALNSTTPWTTAQNPRSAATFQQNPPQRSSSGADVAAGLAGLVITWGLAHDRRQANLILMGVALILLGVFVYSVRSYFF